ncbi:MAG: hypothetical protein HYX78_13720, partial [Armatimonadetes bacterium]|nr:hypothetical protein [Armatimonadota bacterium]
MIKPIWLVGLPGKLMLRWVVCPLVLLVSASLMCYGAASSEPITVPMEGDWQFVYMRNLYWESDDKTAPVLPDVEEYVAKMPVPGFWDDNLDGLRETEFWASAAFNPHYRTIEFPLSSSGQVPDAKLLNLVGIGYYRKTFDVPTDWQGRTVTLQVGGARLNAWIWLNGKFLKYNEMYLVPFEVSLENHLKVGQTNELVIGLANNINYRGGIATWGYQGQCAGIYGPVQLKVAGSCRIADLYVYAQDRNTKLSWNVEVDGNIDGKQLTLAWQVLDPQTQDVLGKGITPVPGRTVNWTSESFGMKPWSDREPNLYRLELTLKQNDDVLDALVQSYGMRRLAVAGTDLKLNGRPVLLRGCTEHYYFPKTCLAPMEIEPYRERLRKLKEIGFNWIRFHSWAPNEQYMQAADELGMMLQAEGTWFAPKEQWEQILRTCRKHPSVVLYCTGNEYTMHEKNIEWTRKVGTWVRKYAPDALFSPMQCLNGIDGMFGDDENLCPSDLITEPCLLSPKRLAMVKEFADVLEPNTTSSAKSALSYAVADTEWRSLEKRLAIYERPVLYHELGILGNYMDLDLEHRYDGTLIGSGLYAAIRRHLTKSGVIEKAPLYYKNSCALMAALRKHALEMGRHSKYFTGYDMLGAWDHQWHRSGYPCGIMNEFLEMKPGESKADVLKYNGESVILLDYSQRRNLVMGRKYQFDIRSSLFGEGPMSNGKLRWYLADSHKQIHDRGEIAVQNARNGKIELLGKISFTAPDLAKPIKLTLFARLSGGEYEIENDWDFWAFPKAAPPDIRAAADKSIIDRYGRRYKGLAPAKGAAVGKLNVVSTINQDTVKFLARGDKVVLLGEGPFPALPTSFDPCPTGRAVGNLATVIADHPALGAFPHEGWCDWQFYPMLTEAGAVVFDDPNLPFNPILEVVSSYKLVRKQANLFELKVGEGKLLVCTMNFDVADPGA